MIKNFVFFSVLLQCCFSMQNEMLRIRPTESQGPGCLCSNRFGIGRDADPNGHPEPQNDKPLPLNCHQIMKNGNTSGIYWIQPGNSTPFQVLCDMDIWDGGWIHIQKRYDGSQDFYLPWRDYKHGFGYLNREHWLGFESIYALAGHQAAELLVELTDHNGDMGYAHYDYFQIGSELEGYKLSVLSGFKGDAGDSLSGHLGMEFTTYDMDRDTCKDQNCAEVYLGAWWYSCCYSCNPNGKFMNMNVPQAYWGKGVQWHTFKNASIEYVHPHSKVRMLVRPIYR